MIRSIITTILLNFFIVNYVSAQLQNASFENWTSDNFPYPENWNVIPNFDAFNGISKTDDAVDGDYAVMIHNWYYYVVKEIGTKTSITRSPISLSGYYKLITENPSSHKSKAICEIGILDKNSNYIGGAEYYFESVSDYTPFDIRINYLTSFDPNSNAAFIEVKFKSSNNYFCENTDCNFFYIDKLELNYAPTNTNQIHSESLSLTSNFINNEINIKGLENTSKISIIDLNGRVIYNSLSDGKEDVSFLKSGFYILSIIDTKGQIHNLKFYKN